MGRLLEDIKIGVTKAGDAIWVDGWDRASRESPYDSINTIRNHILSKGVSIITADDEQVYSHEELRDEPDLFEKMAEGLKAAHYQSRKTSKLVAQAFEEVQKLFDQI